jgi:DNA-binding response OmpR family regulator
MITSGSSAYTENIPQGTIIHIPTGKAVRVTPSELIIYTILSANRGQVIGAQKLANIYAEWFSYRARYSDEGLVRVMIQSIRCKVGANCIETIPMHGYIIRNN